MKFLPLNKKLILIAVIGLLSVFLFQKLNPNNVSAQILPITVSIEHLDFGTVFPGEELQGNLTVTYIDEGNGLAYKLIQRRKPLPSGHPEYPNGGDPEMPGFYRNLCPYLEKVSNEEEGDVENSAFVGGPGDNSDTWIIYFKVPAIFGSVSQDYIGGVISGGGDYGCDISIDIEPPACDPEQELVMNGDFENPVVATAQNWNIYDSGFSGLNWIVGWYGGATSYGGYTRPEPAHLELHRGIFGSAPSGLQYAELDTDWDGPGGPLNNEPASVKIYQELSTVPGRNYNISFYFSPRPETTASNNILEFSWDGLVKDTISAAGDNVTSWNKYNYKFVASSIKTRLQFTDLGTPESLGTFLDNVSVRCVSE